MRSAAKQYWKRAIALALVLSLALSLCFTTTFAADEDDAAGAQTGITVYELTCGLEEHLHDETCAVPQCGIEDETHIHDLSCYYDAQNESLTCEKAEHVHTMACYTALEGGYEYLLSGGEQIVPRSWVLDPEACPEPETGHSHNVLCGVPLPEDASEGSLGDQNAAPAETPEAPETPSEEPPEPPVIPEEPVNPPAAPESPETPENPEEPGETPDTPEEPGEPAEPVAPEEPGGESETPDGEDSQEPASPAEPPEESEVPEGGNSGGAETTEPAGGETEIEDVPAPQAEIPPLPEMEPPVPAEEPEHCLAKLYESVHIHTNDCYKLIFVVTEEQKALLVPAAGEEQPADCQHELNDDFTACKLCGKETTLTKGTTYYLRLRDGKQEDDFGNITKFTFGAKDPSYTLLLFYMDRSPVGRGGGVVVKDGTVSGSAFQGFRNGDSGKFYQKFDEISINELAFMEVNGKYYQSPAIYFDAIYSGGDIVGTQYDIKAGYGGAEHKPLASTSEGILCDVEATPGYNQQAGADNLFVEMTYTIPKDYTGRTIDINVIEDLSKSVGNQIPAYEPGDCCLSFSVTVKNESGKTYSYVNDSAVVQSATSVSDGTDYVCGTEAGYIQDAEKYTFDGQAISWHMAMLRTTNKALESLYFSGIPSLKNYGNLDNFISMTTWENLNDENVDEILIDCGYSGGLADLAQFYLDYSNMTSEALKPGSGTYANLGDLPDEIWDSTKLYNGYQTYTPIRETNPIVAAAGYDYFFNRLLCLVPGQWSTDHEGRYTIGSYMRGICDAADIFGLAGMELAPTGSNTLTTATLYVNGEYAQNNVEISVHQIEMGFQLCTIERTNVEIPVTKVLDGRDFDPYDRFAFSIQACNELRTDNDNRPENIPMPEATKLVLFPAMLDEDFALEHPLGNEQFVQGDSGSFNITYEQPGLYHYTISEDRPTASGIPGVTYDPTIYHVIVAVTANETSGALEAKVAEVWSRSADDESAEWNKNAPAQDITFTNSYSQDEIIRYFRAQKTLTGGSLTAEQFTFILEDQGSIAWNPAWDSLDDEARLEAVSNAGYAADAAQPMPASSAAANGSAGWALFEGTSYTAGDAGEDASSGKVYHYTIREEQPTQDGTMDGAPLPGAVKNEEGRWVYNNIVYSDYVDHLYVHVYVDDTAEADLETDEGGSVVTTLRAVVYGTRQPEFINEQLTTDTTRLTVNKVWVGDTEASRPESITVALMRGDTPEGEAVTLTAENGWTYTWENLEILPEGESWSVREINVPEGYTSRVSAPANGVVTITNTLPDNPPPDNPPPDDPYNPPPTDTTDDNPPPERPEEPPVLPELPDPNEPDSPDTVTIYEDDVPTTYVKVQDPESEEFMYIPEDDIPLYGFETPETGDTARTALWAALSGASLLGAAVLLPKKRKKETEE